MADGGQAATKLPRRKTQSQGLKELDFVFGLQATTWIQLSTHPHTTLTVVFLSLPSYPLPDPRLPTEVILGGIITSG